MKNRMVFEFVILLVFSKPSYSYFVPVRFKMTKHYKHLKFVHITCALY